MNRISESLRVLLWSCVFIFTICGSLQITQVDIWWQLSEGFHILQTFHLPTGPVAAFGLPAVPYFDEYAGYEVVLASIYAIGGFPGIWMVFIAVYLTILYLPSFYSRRTIAHFDLFSCLALLTAGILLKDRLEQRPDLIGTLLQVLLMLLLRKWKLEAVRMRSTIPLFLIFVAWTNTHGSFLFGLLTLGLWISCEFLLKYRTMPLGLLCKNASLLAATAFVAILINPYGPERLWFPFREVEDPAATALSVEMWPIQTWVSIQGISWLVAVLLIGWVILTGRKTPVWLIVYSFFAAYMTYASFRWVSLLVVALLFVYAARDAELKSGPPRQAILRWLEIAGFAFLSIFLLFADSFTLVSVYNETRDQKHFATFSNCYLPEIVDSDATLSHRRPALCGYREGSYLSFIKNTRFQPLLDSGLAHFSDEPKRYLFFALHEPRAFQIALRSLKSDDVIVTRESFAWILAIRTEPGWKMTEISENGMLWQRRPGGVYLPDASEAAEISRCRDALVQQGKGMNAFCYSTLMDRPKESLSLLARAASPGWSDAEFNFIGYWLDTLPRDAIKDYLASDDAKANTALSALLWARVDPGKYEEFVRTAPPGTQPWYGKVVQARVEITNGNLERARAIFAALPPTQPASVAYYGLRHELRMQTSAGEKSDHDPYGQWQTWDEGAIQFMEATSNLLNKRINQSDEQ